MCGNRGSISMCGNRGSISMSGNWCGSNWCSISMCGNWCGSNGNSGLVDSNVVLVNHGSLNNLLDGVNFVGFGHGHGVRDLNGVGFGNMFFNNDFPFDRDGHSNGNFDGIFVYLEFGFDSGDLGSDAGVGADGCSNFLNGNGVSGSRSLVSGCRGDGSIWCRCSGDCRGCNGDGGLGGFGCTSNIGVRCSLVNRLFLSVGVSDLNGLRSNLNGAVSDDFLDSLVVDRSGDNVFMNLGSDNSGCGISMCGNGGLAESQGSGDVAGLAHSHQH